MSSEEEDYMSDKFLVGSADVRPSLVHNRTKRRLVDIETKQAEILKRQKQDRLERSGANRNELLQKSLDRPIASENRGFQLLAKMGYKPGQSLGKSLVDKESKSVDKPLTVPIGITIKSDRGGLGRESALRELAEKRKELRAKRLKELAGGSVMSAEEFRARATQKAEERFMLGALRRCQLSCENLDRTNGVDTPEILWFWPEHIDESEKDESSEADNISNDHEEEVDGPEMDEYTTAEKVEMLTNYLRISYRFCFWCGEQYSDQLDMDSNCPGLTKDDH